MSGEMRKLLAIRNASNCTLNCNRKEFKNILKVNSNYLFRKFASFQSNVQKCSGFQNHCFSMD